MTSMRIALAVVLLTSSCSKYVVTARPPDLGLHASELVTRGTADVFDADGKLVRIAADDPVDVTVVDDNTQHRAHMTVRELVAGCVASPDSSSCLARHVADEVLVLRSGYRFDRARLETGLAFGVMGAAIGGCIAACEGGSELSRQLAYGGLVVAGTMLLVVILLHSGGRD
jgi:hypothetical protein